MKLKNLNLQKKNLEMYRRYFWYLLFLGNKEEILLMWLTLLFKSQNEFKDKYGWIRGIKIILFIL